MNGYLVVWYALWSVVSIVPGSNPDRHFPLTSAGGLGEVVIFFSSERTSETWIKTNKKNINKTSTKHQVIEIER